MLPPAARGIGRAATPTISATCNKQPHAVENNTTYANFYVSGNTTKGERGSNYSATNHHVLTVDCQKERSGSARIALSPSSAPKNPRRKYSTMMNQSG